MWWFTVPQEMQKRLIKEYVKLAKEKGFVEFDPCFGRNVPLDQSAKDRIAKLEAKLTRHRMDGDPNLKWEYVSGGIARLDYEGKKTRYVIPPNIFLVGTVGDSQIFTKFVSHPFHQWSLINRTWYCV